MAIQTTAQKLYDSQRNVVMQFTGLHDGLGGGDNEKSVTKIDVSQLIPAANRQLKVRNVTYAVGGGTVRLDWAGNDPSTFMVLGGGWGEFCYDRMSGANNPGVADSTVKGNITLSTIGFSAGSFYTIRIDLLKT